MAPRAVIGILVALGLIALLLYAAMRPTADTEENIFGEAHNRAAVRARALASRIRQFERDSGAFPTTPWEVLDTTDSLLAYDPWGRLFRYAEENRVITIRSAGEDGVFESLDDVVLVDSMVDR